MTTDSTTDARPAAPASGASGRPLDPADPGLRANGPSDQGSAAMNQGRPATDQGSAVMNQERPATDQRPAALSQGRGTTAPVDAGRAPTVPAPGPGDTPPGPRRATRVSEGALLGGVCTGLARHLGWPVMVFRIGFVALLITQFVGVLVYGLLWLLLPPERAAAEAPGLEAASRDNKRDASIRRPRR